MVESTVEKSHIKSVKENGGKAYKFVSPGCIGVPDRIDLYPIKNKRHREIVAKYVQFTECKAPNKKVKNKSPQDRRIKEFQDFGFVVNILDRKV